MDRYRELFSNTLVFAFGSIGSKLLIFFLVPLYTHYLTKADYGIADLVFSVGQLLLPFVSLAIFNGLLRFGLATNVPKENVLFNTFLVFTIGSIVVLFLSLIVPWIYPVLGEWKWYLVACVIAQFAFTNTQVYLKVKDFNKYYAIVSIFQAACLMGMNVWLIVFLRLGIEGYLLSTIVANGAAALLAFCLGGMLGDLQRASYDKLLMYDMVVYSVPFILNDLSWWGIDSANKVFLEIFTGAGALGVFVVASKLPHMLNTVVGIFLQSWGLSAVREYETANDYSFYSNVLNGFIFFLVGVCVLMIAFIKPFMYFYVDEKFFIAWRYMPMLFVCAGLAAITGFMGSLYSALKLSAHYMYTTLLGAIVNVAVSYVAIPHFGIWGAVAGSTLGYMVIAFTRWYDVHRYLKFSFDYCRALVLLALVVLQAVTVVILPEYVMINIAAILIYLVIVRKEIGDVYYLLKRRFV